jgi:uncharacterized repeat protein (TIGR01451 family)
MGVHPGKGRRAALVLVLSVLAALLGFQSALAFTVTRVSSPVLYMDSTENLFCGYAAYRVVNTTGTPQNDVWLQVHSFTGAVIGTAPTEDGWYRLGAMAPGDTSFAFVYLTASAQEPAPQTHSATVYDARTSGNVLATADFTLTSMETIQASANKVTSTLFGPNPPGLGGIMILTVEGETGIVGAAGIFAASPASFLGWEADAFRLTDVEMVMTGSPNAGTYRDSMFWVLPSTQNTSYIITYTFVVTGVTTQPTLSGPVNYISSGAQIKHTTDVGDPAIVQPVQPTSNAVTLDKKASPAALLGAGTVTYTVTIRNADTIDVALEYVEDLLPSSPDAAQYVPGSATFQAAPIPDPGVAGQLATFVGPFAVAGLDSATLVYQATVSDSAGTYSNRAAGLIGSEQIDTTLVTGDDAPAVADVVVLAPSPRIGAAKAVTAGPANNGDGSHTVTYTVTAGNYGDVVLRNLQLTDDLGAAFAGADSFRVDSAVSGRFAVGGAYSGADPDTLLLAGTDTLDIGESGTVDVTVTVWPGFTVGPYANRVLARGEDFQATRVTDASVPGADPDLDGNGDPGDDTGTTDVVFSGNPSLGAAKGVTAGPLNNGDGSHTLTYTLTVRNYGNLPLRNLQASDDLGTAFAAADSFRVDSVTSGSFAVNGAYTGTDPDTLLLAGTDTLDIGETSTVLVTVTVWPGFTAGPHANRAFVQGEDFTTGVAFDGSVNGTNPDLDGNGNPGDDGGATEVTFGGLPSIGVAKAVTGGPVNNGDGSHTLAFTFTVENYGNVSLRNLQVSDDLAAAFAGTDSFQVNSLTSGAFGVDGGYMGTSPDTLLLAGTDTLDIGAVGTVNLTVTVWPGFSGGPHGNIAFASGEDLTATTVTDESVSGTDPDADGNGDPADDGGTTDVTFGGSPGIGAAKAVTAGPVNNGDGSHSLTYTLTVGNYGDLALRDLQVTDDLAATFAGADSFRVDLVSSAAFAVNGAFTGTAPDTLLLTGTDTLFTGRTSTVALSITVWPGLSPGPFGNRATASGRDFLGTVVTDGSVAGVDPDANGDGDPTDDDGTTDVTFGGTPRIGLAKAVTAGPVSNGDGSHTLSYTLVARNYGDVPLQDVQLTDDLSATFAAADSFRVDSVTSGSLSVNGAYTGAGPDTLVLDGTDVLNVGQSGAVTLTVTVWPGLIAGPYANRALASAVDFLANAVVDGSVNGADPDANGNGDPTDDTSTTDVITANPRIGIAKAVTAGPANNGDSSHTLVYTLVVRNYGNVALQNVEVSDDLAAAFAGADSFRVDLVSSAAFAVNGAFTGTAPDTLLLTGSDVLGIGGSGTVDLTVTVWPGTNPGPHANRAFASGEDFAATGVGDGSVAGGDPDPNGNGDPADDGGTTEVTFTGTAVIGVAKAVAAGPVNNGDGSLTLTYSLIVRNYGDLALQNVQISDDLGAAFAGADSFRVDLAASPGLGVSGTYTGTSPDTLLLTGADVLNPGAAGAVLVTVTVWPGFNAGPYGNRGFAEGEDWVGTIVIDGSVAGTDPDPDGDGDPTDDGGPTTITFGGTPLIGAAKRVAVGPVNNGDGSHSLTYSILVRNYGDLALRNVQISDDLSAAFAGADSFRVDSATSGTLTVNGVFTGTGPDTLLLAGADTLSVGASATATVAVTVWPGLTGGPYGNRAFAAGLDFTAAVVRDGSVNGANPDPGGNGDPTDDGGTTDVTFGGTPRIGVAKAVTAGPVNNGDGSHTVTYTLNVENYGDLALQNLQVTDDLGATFAGADSFQVNLVAAPGLTTNDAYTGSAPDTALLAGIDVLGIGESASVSIALTVWPGFDLGPHANRAFARGTDFVGGAATDASVDGADPDPDGNGDPTDNEETTPVTFTGTPSIGVAKAVMAGPVNNGDGSHTLTYTLTARNYGNVPLRNLRVSDDLEQTFAGADSFRVDAFGSNSLTVNSAFTGTAPDTGLLAGSDSLAVITAATVDLTVTVWPGLNPGPYANRAHGEGENLVVVRDASTAGTDPDANGNGDPTDDDAATTVTFGGSPAIGLAKDVVSGPTDNGDGSHTLVYGFTVENFGDLTLLGVQVGDDLEAAFAGADSFRVDGVAGTGLSPDPSYTGIAPDTLLLAGTDALGLGESGAVQVTVILWPGFHPGPHLNRAFAASVDFLGTPVTDASTRGGNPDADGNGDPGDDAEPTPVLLDIAVAPEILLTKKASVERAVVGDIVPYAVDVRRLDDGPAVAVTLGDLVPPGFSYVEDSARLLRAGGDRELGTADDSVSVAAAAGGRPLTFGPLTVGREETVRLTYFLRVGAGASPGGYENRVTAFVDGDPAGNTASARVTVTADPLMGKTTVLGKVFNDQDRDGFQDRGLAHGVRISISRTGRSEITGATLIDAGGSRLLAPQSLVAGFELGDFPAQNAIGTGPNRVRLRLELSGETFPAVTLTSREGTTLRMEPDGSVIEGHTGRMRSGASDQKLRLERKILPGARGSVVEFTVTNEGLDEQGIPGVRLATTDGLVITTDPAGRYHLADVDGGRWELGRNVILKVDPASLPPGSEFTTENPRVLHITSQVLNRMSFGVHLPEGHSAMPSEPDTASLALTASVRPGTVVSLLSPGHADTLILSHVTFASGKADLQAAARGVLSEAAKRLREVPGATARIEGHTDHRPISNDTFADNYELSGARAAAVMQELKSRYGIDAKRMLAVGYGPDRPLTLGKTASDLQRNRRVEIVIYAEGLGGGEWVGTQPDAVTYSLRYAYSAQIPLEVLGVEVRLPGRMAYRPGSSRLDDASVADPKVVAGDDGALLRWTLPAPGAKPQGTLAFNAGLTGQPGAGRSARGRLFWTTARGDEGATPEVDVPFTVVPRVKDFELAVAVDGGSSPERSTRAVLEDRRQGSGEDDGPSEAWSTLRLPNGGVLWVVPESGPAGPRLDVRAPEEVYVDGRGLVAPVPFAVYCNYPSFVTAWELALYDEADEARENPVAVLRGDGFPTEPVVTWNGDDKRKAGDVLVYVLRVFDASGRRDETHPRSLDVFADRGLSPERNLPGEVHGQTNLARQTIPLRGGFVRVHGAGLGASRVTVQGMEQPAGGGAFASEWMVPFGPGRLGIDVTSPGGETYQGALEVDLARNSLFLVGMADLVAGKNTVSGNPELTAGDPHFDGDVFTDGRLAFYLKGLAKGKYRVTAQLDSREEALEDFFQNLDRKDPRTLFRRLDPDLYYTNYGDGSVTVPDVDTQGRFYGRLEWDRSQILWGNYATGLTGTEYGQFNRSLYGASLRHEAVGTTRYGDPRVAAAGFASEARSAFAHQEFLGTGGSLYYLRHTDIVQGSEKLWVEVRDRDSDRVIENVALRRGQDYEMDEIQGRILLTRPLMQVAGQAAPSIVKDEPLDGNRVLLMADYEYVPDGFSGEDMTVGGRVKVWPDDAVGVGGTYVSEERGGRDYTLRGGDVVLRGGPSTFLKVEVAASEEAQTLTRSYSGDGGLTFSDAAPVPGVEADGEAYSVEGRWGEAAGGPRPVAAGWWKRRTAGFSTARLASGVETTDYGAELQWGNGGPWTLGGRLAVQDRDAAGEDRKITAQGRYRLNERWNVSGELRQLHTRAAPAAAVDALLAGLRVGYAPIPAMEIYAAGQGAVDSDSAYADNALATLGIRARFSPRIGLRVEGSAGDRGQSAQVGANVALNADHEMYGTYTLSSDRVDGPQGTATVGQRRRLSRQADIFSENQFTHGERQAGLSHVYGLNFSPRESFSTALTLQRSDVTDRTQGAIDRDAVSLCADYRGEHGRYSLKGEYRDDNGAVDVRQWVTANRGDFTILPALTLVGKFNYSYSKNLTTSSTDARFMETGLGLAYRALTDERLNLLAKHTYLFDIPSPSQAAERPAQRSHVFSGEALYLLTAKVEGGVHYAHRRGEVRMSREAGEWTQSRANLAALRGRYHLIRRWDAWAEYRWLWVNEAEDMKQGALLGVYRHVGDHLKLGAGYNFTDFSDDLTDLGYDSRGWFVTAVGKY